MLSVISLFLTVVCSDWIYYDVSRGHYRLLSKNFKNDTNIKLNILNSAAGTFGKLALYID